MKRIVRLLGIVALAIVVGSVWQSAVPTVVAQERPPQGPPGPPQGPGLFGNEDFVGRLSANLGIPPEQLMAAVQQTMRELEARQPSRPAATPGMPPEPVLRMTVQILGIEPDALGHELGQGKSLAQIAAERGMDPDAYAEALAQGMERMQSEQRRQQVREMIDKPMQPGMQGPDR